MRELTSFKAENGCVLICKTHGRELDGEYDFRCVAIVHKGVGFETGGYGKKWYGHVTKLRAPSWASCFRI